MSTIDLNGKWQLTFARAQQAAPPSTKPSDEWLASSPSIPATVPGNVELDLVTAGILPDLSVGNNIYLLREYETYEWVYQRAFDCPALEPGQRAELVFEGLDCYGTIWLNGQRVGRTDNMLIAHRFDVTDILKVAQSAGRAPVQLVVRIDSAVLEGRRHQPDAAEFAFAMSWEALDARKAPHMYGWDIMPRAVTAGLWRGVHLDILGPTRWQSVYWATLKADRAARTATLLADWHFVTDRPDVDALRVCIRVRRAEASPDIYAAELPLLGTHGQARLKLADIDLWWPRGYGDPTRYDAQLELVDEKGALLDTHRCRIGLRTVELRCTDGDAGQPGEFVFLVNGERIYAKGTNWVPLDAFHSRDPQHVKPAIDMAVDLNCNMIRCWGGNVYEDHDFFDLCDENGILVWQDFAMACAIYPQTDDFASRIRAEAEAVVVKLRNHPSLALWAGNNEIDETYSWAGLNVDPNTDRLSRQVLPDVTRRLDPARSYLPSSPYRSPELVRRGDAALQPEQHLWGPRDDFKGPYYTTSQAHFVSEIGYHGCPDRRSLEQFLDPDFLWPWQDNDQWLTHATRPHRSVADWNYRIPLMAKQTAVLFARVPENLDDFVLASQIVQAEAKKFFVEWWRQGKPDHTGMLWWNLRDGWPIISDAIVDYYGRKKLAYAYLKRAQADVCAIVAEPRDGRHAVVVVNDTLTPAAGRVSVRDADSGQILFEGGFEVGPDGLCVAGHIAQASQPAMWLIEAVAGDAHPQHNHYLAGPRPYRLDDYRRWLDLLEIPDDVGPGAPTPTPASQGR